MGTHRRRARTSSSCSPAKGRTGSENLEATPHRPQFTSATQSTQPALLQSQDTRDLRLQKGNMRGDVVLDTQRCLLRAHCQNRQGGNQVSGPLSRSTAWPAS